MESNIRALGLRSWGGGQGRALGRGGACSGVWAACVRSCRGKFPGPGRVRGHRAEELGRGVGVQKLYDVCLEHPIPQKQEKGQRGE